ncbi:4Fe-4S binding protein [Sideroxydans lithotrophicus]|uniref:Polyferredoxin-like protein n=1 Tax=Sideroxydans lithotrophicus (strain ES-1) TaxID=580332 RepID=D5CNU7_SIDLE|nr:4Fe-4S dicluster domain-containing protein [Sideroxydans lithotrophicus]ADE12868.1 Polyferredoxin-like protein [Sideroxydans lithotrophicus ES-1]
MSSGINKTLSSIPIKIVDLGMKKGASSYRWRRRALQIVILILLVLIPVSGLFRIDPENGALVVLGWQIWFADFFLVTGLWIMIATSLVALYSIAGTVFCGWACPQNSLAEWANYMTHKLLGKRAEVSLTGEAPKVAAAKNKALNWTMLGLSFLVAAMFFALLPLLYFYPPDVVWSFLSFKDDTRLAGSLYWIYFVWVLIILLDIAVLRHFWCRFACVYKVWQHSFKTKETLHVLYDSSRADECEKCNYCVTTCFIELDPRKTEMYDSCINCGDCIDACNTLHAKKGGVGLLKFELGQRTNGKIRRLRDNSMLLLSRFRWIIPFAILGMAMFAWGVWSYQPYHISVGFSEAKHSQSERDYRIEISSKRYRPTELDVAVEGLPQDDFTLSGRKVNMESVGRTSIFLSVSPKLQRGLYPLAVVVHSSDGWTGRFKFQHFVE